MHIHTLYRYCTGREAQRARRQGHETDQVPRSYARGVYPPKEPFVSTEEPYICIRKRGLDICQRTHVNRQGYERDQDPRSNARGEYPQKEPYASTTEPYIYICKRAIHVYPQKRSIQYITAKAERACGQGHETDQVPPR